MKIRAPRLLLHALLAFVFAASAGAALIRMFRMDQLVADSDLVVYCDEKDIQYQSIDRGNWKETSCLVKCKVLQVFKGDVAPDVELAVTYDGIFRRGYSTEALGSQQPKNIPPGKALLFLQKDKEGAYTVKDAKLLQKGQVFVFIQIMNPGPLALVEGKPENLLSVEGQKYGEKELLEDVAIAVKKSVSLKKSEW